MDLAAEHPRTALGILFDALEQAMRSGDRARLPALWHELGIDANRGIDANLVGGSGLSGAEASAQGSAKHWFRKPDLATLAVTRDVGALRVTCAVGSMDKQRAGDRVHVVVVRAGAGWVVLGAGERLDEVDGLLKR